jgi:mRNA-degrading endonuclease RelE of RelBE toxin-antitoxin system
MGERHGDRVMLAPRAVKDVGRLDRKAQARVHRALGRLADDDPSLNIKRLTDSRLARVRVGELRIIYEVNAEIGKIVVARVVQRGAAYKKK